MVKPVGYRILVKDVEVEKVSDGGIIIATDERLETERAAKAKVLGVGETAFAAFRTIDHNGNEVNGRSPINVGDTIYYAPYAGRTIKDRTPEGGWLRLITDDDVMGVEEGEAA